MSIQSGFISQLFHLLTVFDFANKNFGWLKAGNKVLINYQCGVA
jgi:hypothetical protein